jgi:hypothetical protein
MPARREVDDAAAELERLRGLANDRQRRRRQRLAASRDGHATHHVTPIKGEAAGAVTPPSPARHSVPPKTLPLPPKGGSPSGASVRAAPKPNKSGDVIDLLKAAGLPHQLEKADHQAVKASPLSPAQIVEAFGAVYHGQWGGEWLRQNLNVQAVIKRYAGYLSWKERPAAPTPPAPYGVFYQPNSLRHNRQPPTDDDWLPMGELVPIGKAEFERTVAANRGLTLEQKRARLTARLNGHAGEGGKP